MTKNDRWFVSMVVMLGACLVVANGNGIQPDYIDGPVEGWIAGLVWVLLIRVLDWWFSNEK